MKNDDQKIIEVLTEHGYIDDRHIYCLGAVNKLDAGYLFGAVGGMASAVAAMVYICLNSDELIIVKLDMETMVLQCKLSDISIEKLKTGFMGGKLIFRCEGKKRSFDCTNDFVKAFAPIAGVAL